jgi:hypothetical protein
MIAIKVGADGQLNWIIYHSVRGTIRGVIMGGSNGIIMGVAWGNTCMGTKIEYISDVLIQEYR